MGNTSRIDIRRALFVACAMICSLAPAAWVWGDENSEEDLESPPEPSPWFTGPLLTPSVSVIPWGHFNLEPYVYYTANTSAYDAHWAAHSIDTFYSLAFPILIQVGFPGFELDITPQATYQWTEGEHTTTFNDLPIQLGFQVLADGLEESWTPSIRLNINETFPTGEYQLLDPRKLRTDVGGQGAYMTTVGVGLGKLIHFSGAHFLASRLYLSYSYSAPVHVKGFNAYGGGFEANGTVYPGNDFNTLIGLEFSVTQNWVLALDISNEYTNKTRSKGVTGIRNDGTATSLSSASSNQISLAPALEYNWNSHLGVIAGVWWTVAGRNSTRFLSGVAALNYYY